jgi:hypothetical protein
LTRFPAQAADPQASALAGSAALGDYPANDHYRGYGREFRCGWLAGPVFDSVQFPSS